MNKRPAIHVFKSLNLSPGDKHEGVLSHVQIVPTDPTKRFKKESRKCTKLSYLDTKNPLQVVL